MTPTELKEALARCETENTLAWTAEDCRMLREAAKMTQEEDIVNNPKHYTSHPSGIECIEITRHMGFCLGNAVKYIWRADLKGNDVEDLRKAIWYIEDEIKKRVWYE